MTNMRTARWRYLFDKDTYEIKLDGVSYFLSEEELEVPGTLKLFLDQHDISVWEFKWVRQWGPDGNLGKYLSEEDHL